MSSRTFVIDITMNKTWLIMKDEQDKGIKKTSKSGSTGFKMSL